MAGGAGEIRAPMPGNILDVAVRPGETVTVGQALCALEAMKMKSAIRSPRNARVKAVHVADGQPVAHGDLLVTLE
jgi:biotin carboxyl carrier protein